MNLSRFFTRLTAEATGKEYQPAPPTNGPTFPRRDDGENGALGVPVPAGPHPIRGGAAAQMPIVLDDETVNR